MIMNSFTYVRIIIRKQLIQQAHVLMKTFGRLRKVSLSDEKMDTH